MHVYFYSARQLSDGDLLQVARTVSPVSHLIHSRRDSDEEQTDADKTTLLIKVENRPGIYLIDYECWWLYRHGDLTKRQQVDFLIELAQLTQTDLITEDEGFYPFGFISIKPESHPVAVSIDAEAYDGRGEIVIERFETQSWGMVTIHGELTGELQEKLLRHLPSGITAPVFTPIDPELIDRDFREAQGRLSSLASFDHFYIITPDQPGQWYSKDERSALMADKLEEFSRIHGISICLFPVNGSRVQNIPGGSDHESKVILLSEQGQEVIIFKELRKSW